MSSYLPVRRAIAVGHIVVNLPMIAIMMGVVAYGMMRHVPVPVALAVGAFLSWPWWSIAAPRWRAWALSRGTPAGVLQREAVRNGLLWPKGWIFERSEIPVRRK